ncbi:MAG TPA: hypothetical protein VIH42_02470 [Thermoguttaceae bacterium]
MGSKLWKDIVLFTAPVFLTAVLGVLGWILIGMASAEYRSLTVDDERRIVAEAQVYADKQVAGLRQDIDYIRQDVSEIRDLQAQILILIQK